MSKETEKFINPALNAILAKKRTQAEKNLQEASQFCKDIKLAEKYLGEFGVEDYKMTLETNEALQWDAENRRIVYINYVDNINTHFISSKLKVRQRLQKQFETFFDGAMG